MRDYIDITGRNEEEAIRKGLEQLGLDRDEVSVEILERAKAGFLGFGSAPAKIRMSYGPDKAEPMPEPVAAGNVEATEEPAREVSAPAPAAERPERKERPARKKADAPKVVVDAPKASGAEPAADTPKRGSRKRGQERRKAEKTEKAEKVEKTEKQKPVAVEEPVAASAAVPTEEVDDEKATAIRAFLTGLLKHMDCEAEVRVYQPEEGRYKVILEGSGMGALIGRRGETLDAIQQLTNYSVNRNGVRVRIQLDAEGYREKREQSLKNLARKEAAKVVKYRRSRTLEPMNAYERHVIHTALQDFPGVNTYSTGVDPNRRVVIAFDRENA